MAVDDFDKSVITEWEGGQRLYGYVPVSSKEGSSSGLTIATGLDLSRQLYSELEGISGLLPETLALFKPYLATGPGAWGLTHTKGQLGTLLSPGHPNYIYKQAGQGQDIENRKITITQPQAQIIDDYFFKKSETKAKEVYKSLTGVNSESGGGPRWEDLSKAQRTVMVDIVHNMGRNAIFGYPKLKKAIGSGNWTDAIAEMGAGQSNIEGASGWSNSETANRMLKRAQYLRQQGIK